MFGLRRKSKPDDAYRRSLEDAMRDRLGLGAGDSVRVYEVACGVPGCPDVVTAMLVMRENLKTEIFRVAKDLPAVTVDDLAEAARGLAQRQDGFVKQAFVGSQDRSDEETVFDPRST